MLYIFSHRLAIIQTSADFNANIANELQARLFPHGAGVTSLPSAAAQGHLSHIL